MVILFANNIGRVFWRFVVVCKQTWLCFFFPNCMQLDSYSRNLLSQPSNNWQELSLLRSFWFVIKSPTLKLLQSGVHVACSNWSACELPGNHQPCYQYLFILLFQSKHAACYWIRCSSYGLWFVSSTVFSRRYVLATNNVMAILVDKFVYCACVICAADLLFCCAFDDVYD